MTYLYEINGIKIEIEKDYLIYVSQDKAEASFDIHGNICHYCIRAGIEGSTTGIHTNWEIINSYTSIRRLFIGMYVDGDPSGELIKWDHNGNKTVTVHDLHGKDITDEIKTFVIDVNKLTTQERMEIILRYGSHMLPEYTTNYTHDDCLGIDKLG